MIALSDILLYFPWRLKQAVAVGTLVASHFVSVFYFFFKGYKNVCNISIQLF